MALHCLGLEEINQQPDQPENGQRKLLLGSYFRFRHRVPPSGATAVIAKL